MYRWSALTLARKGITGVFSTGSAVNLNEQVGRFGRVSVKEFLWYQSSTFNTEISRMCTCIVWDKHSSKSISKIEDIPNRLDWRKSKIFSLRRLFISRQRNREMRISNYRGTSTLAGTGLRNTLSYRLCPQPNGSFISNPTPDSRAPRNRINVPNGWSTKSARYISHVVNG